MSEHRSLIRSAVTLSYVKTLLWLIVFVAASELVLFFLHNEQRIANYYWPETPCQEAK